MAEGQRRHVQGVQVSSEKYGRLQGRITGAHNGKTRICAGVEMTETEAKPLPRAEATLMSWARQTWLVRRCPFCGQQHAHSAGQGNEDPMWYLRQVPAGCRAKCHRGKGYQLVELQTKYGRVVR